MATARETIAAALRLIGVKGSGDSLDATEDSEHIVTLNDFMEGLAQEGLLVPSRTLETLTWASGNASRTIGAAGNLVTVRPLKIESAFIRDGNIDYPLALISAKEYQEIADKTQTAAIPSKLFYSPTPTSATLYFWPVPSQSVTLGLSSFKPFTALAIGDTLAFLPGYNKLIRYGMAVELAPEYGKQASPEVMAIFSDLKDTLKRANSVVPKMRFDGVPGVGSTFDIYTGEE